MFFNNLTQNLGTCLMKLQNFDHFLKISVTTVVLNVSNSPHTGSKHPDFVHISLI